MEMSFAWPGVRRLGVQRAIMSQAARGSAIAAQYIPVRVSARFCPERLNLTELLRALIVFLKAEGARQ